MNMDMLDMLTLSASRYIQQAEQAGDAGWASSLYGLADRYIGELSRITHSQPELRRCDLESDSTPPGGGYWV